MLRSSFKQYQLSQKKKYWTQIYSINNFSEHVDLLKQH